MYQWLRTYGRRAPMGEHLANADDVMNRGRKGGEQVNEVADMGSSGGSVAHGL